jgi:peptidoglycan/LPS O-acetylase OafA/YrhL
VIVFVNRATVQNKTVKKLDLTVLDALRGLAACYVMVGHASGLLWAGLDTVARSEEGPGLWLAYLAHHTLRWQHEAVLLFFVLSGFCIHYRQAQQLMLVSADHAGRPPSPNAVFNIWGFAQRRVRRLFPPLVVALGLTALFDYVGTQINPGFYGSLTLSPSPSAPLPSHSLSTLVGNLLMQASFVVPPFGSNGPLWSLAFETGFYVLYPVLLLASARLGGVRMLLGTAAVALLTLFVVPAGTPAPGDSLSAYQAGGAPVWIPLLLMYWLVWALGAFVAEVYTGRICFRGLTCLAAVSLAALVALAITLDQFVSRPGWWRLYDLAWGTGLAVLLGYLLLAAPGMVGAWVERSARGLAWLGDISYSLYVVHLPWIVLVAAFWSSRHANLPGGGELAIGGAISALALAGCCWYFVERHCVSVRRRGALPAERRPAPAAVASSST